MNEIETGRTEETHVKRKLFIGITTIAMSSPVIIWALVLVISRKNYFPSTFGTVLLFAQAIGVAGGILLCLGKISGYYTSICAWVLLVLCSILRTFFLYNSSSVMVPRTYSYYGLSLIILGIIFLYALVSKILKGRSAKA